jgi:phosphopantothenoylcysteine decarboxylase/phosphopantothenate--cysteine ligase
VMTPSATDFITPLTLSVLSKNPVSVGGFDAKTGEWNNHVHLASWADMFIIAPTSANTIAKMAYGVCDNMLMTVYLSATCKKYIAPAMDAEMWNHTTSKKNIATLQQQGCFIIPPAAGELASGITGEGRMEEPEKILEIISKDFFLNLPLSGKKALVTAGPTRESIDPVRYISNRSSGKMGFAVAQALMSNGADVTLVTGPSSIKTPDGINTIRVETTEEMADACMKVFKDSDITVMAAAVADYAPEKFSVKKLKKNIADENLKMIKTQDILAALGKRKNKNQFLVGFALENENEVANAKEKLREKNLDMIVLNSLNDAGAGFEHDTNKISIIDGKKVKTFALKSKIEAAEDIVKEIISRLHKK